MESDDSDFREGPSFHSLKQEKRVKFETPVRKDNKKSGTKNSYFKMKENKYLVRKKVENHQLGDSKLKSKTEHSKHVIGKDKSGLIETVKFLSQIGCFLVLKGNMVCSQCRQFGS